jgi:zinc protease
VLAGDFDPDRACEIATRLFGGSEAAAPSPAPVVEAAPRDQVRIVVVDRPAAAQTELRIAQVGIARTDPDRTAMGFLNSLLGGKFTSRINLNLRERLGITYGAFSRLGDRRSRGPFVVAAAVTTASTGVAAREVLGELRRLRDESISSAEIDETRSYLLGVFPYGLQTVEGLAARLRDIALFDLPLDHPRRVLDEYARLNAADLAAVAARQLRPEEALVVAAGPAAQIVESLRELGPLRVETPEAGATSY